MKLRAGKRNAISSFSPTLPLRLRWGMECYGSFNRNAVAFMTATCFQLADCIRSQFARFLGNFLSLW